MATDPSDSPILERAYYLPPQGSGLEDEWGREALPSQRRYADLCQRGHTIIANQIIAGRQNGHRPSLKELYKTAARIRRAIAVPRHADTELPPDFFYSRFKWHLYGQPAAAPFFRLRDTINGQGRYAHHFEEATAEFASIKLLVEEGRFRKEFGAQYTANIRQEESFTIIDITDTKHQVIVASLEHAVDIDGHKIRLYHARLKDHDKLFALADRHWEKLYNATAHEPAEFWRGMGAISLDLFHIAPLQLGSQTSTLMMLAGITKAMGYEIIPRRPRMDHFIAAELTPYRQYIEHYEDAFIRKPLQLPQPQRAIAVDDSFITTYLDIVRKHFDYPYNPSAMLNTLNIYVSRLRGDNKASITGLTLENGKITVQTVFPKHQDAINYALDFTGHADVAHMLSLREGTFAAGVPLMRRVVKNNDLRRL